MIEGEFAAPPPPSKPGPKKGQAGRKSTLFTDDKVKILTENPGRWVVLKQRATQSQYSNAVQWVKRNQGFRVVGRRDPTGPKDTQITLFAIYQDKELDASEE